VLLLLHVLWLSSQHVFVLLLPRKEHLIIHISVQCQNNHLSWPALELQLEFSLSHGNHICENQRLNWTEEHEIHLNRTWHKCIHKEFIDSTCWELWNLRDLFRGHCWLNDVCYIFLLFGNSLLLVNYSCICKTCQVEGFHECVVPLYVQVSMLFIFRGQLLWLYRCLKLSGISTECTKFCLWEAKRLQTVLTFISGHHLPVTHLSHTTLVKCEQVNTALIAHWFTNLKESWAKQRFVAKQVQSCKTRFQN
jgi:hypothetical protein